MKINDFYHSDRTFLEWLLGRPKYADYVLYASMRIFGAYLDAPNTVK